MRILKTAGAWFKRHTSRAVASATALLLATSASRAQEQTSNIDLSAASTAVDEMAQAVKTFFTGDLLDAILMVIGAGFVVFAVFLAVKFIRRGTRSAA